MQKDKLVLGIDEAGRGPIIGPLVIAGILIKEKDIPKLKALKVKDSKLLKNHTRNHLDLKIKEIIKSHKIIIIQPKEIDEALRSEDLNLNWLEAIKTAEIINSLNPDQALIDCPSPNIPKYRNYLINLLKNKDIEVVCSHKAESLFLPVAAASILAKVTRDKEIEKIHKKIGNSFGSGYPADPKTQEFIKKNWQKYPKIFRKSWSTYQNLVKQKNQKSLSEFR